MAQLDNADIIEALLFASDKPVPLKKLARAAGLEPDQATEEIAILREERSRIGALQIVEVAGGWQLVSKPEFAPFIKQLRDVPRQRLSRAAFEVMAIVAYRQPVTRGDIEGLRGVDCSAPLQFLLEKKLVAISGRKEAPGRPWLYATTPQFLDHFGLAGLSDLPTLEELAELNDVSPEGASRSLFARPPMHASNPQPDRAEEQQPGAAMAPPREGQADGGPGIGQSRSSDAPGNTHQNFGGGGPEN